MESRLWQATAYLNYERHCVVCWGGEVVAGLHRSLSSGQYIAQYGGTLLEVHTL